MGHFSGAFCLCVKTSLHIKPINGKYYTCRFIFMQIKLILRWKFCTRTCFETVRHTVKSEIAWNKKKLLLLLIFSKIHRTWPYHFILLFYKGWLQNTKYTAVGPFWWCFFHCHCWRGVLIVLRVNAFKAYISIFLMWLKEKLKTW